MSVDEQCSETQEKTEALKEEESDPWPLYPPRILL
jgi:hypothetical protein